MSLSPSPSKPSDDGRSLSDADLFDAFHSAYRRSGASANKLFEAAASAYAVAELLIARGLIGLEELDERRRLVEERLMRSYEQAGLTVEMEHNAPDKYQLGPRAVEIDCEQRLPLCGAACCRLVFALSRQDIEERVIQWELTRPYIIRHRPDSYCVHCDGQTHLCTVYAQRPYICRGYDCRRDTRIWQDFDNRVVNPELEKPGWPFRPTPAGDRMVTPPPEPEPEAAAGGG